MPAGSRIARRLRHLENIDAQIGAGPLGKVTSRAETSGRCAASSLRHHGPNRLIGNQHLSAKCVHGRVHQDFWPRLRFRKE
jgi:hypothetical protein